MSASALEVPCTSVAHPIVARPPGSKSITNRALILAAACTEPTELLNPLESDDTRFASEALGTLGISVEQSPGRWIVRGPGFQSSSSDPAHLFLGNAGTATRFLSAVLCAAGRTACIDGNARMRQRPIEPLLQALRDLGGDIRSELDNGCPPLRIGPGGLRGGSTAISGQISSQFFSGLLLAAPFAQTPCRISVTDAWLSRPYIEMSQRMLAAFGVTCHMADRHIDIPAPQTFRTPGTFAIEPDASSATYPLALAMLHGVPGRVLGLGPHSLQGDVAFAHFLEQMGASVSWESDAISIEPPATLQPLRAHLAAIPDAAMTLVILCAVASGTSELTGLRNLRVKECDRLAALETELSKLGARIRATDDGFLIHGVAIDQLRPATLATYDDHRVAMCLGLLGTRIPGLHVEDPNCVAKTYPQFWTDLAAWLHP